MIFILIFGLSGCVTANHKSNLQTEQFEQRIRSLEMEVVRKNQEIGQLEQENAELEDELDRIKQKEVSRTGAEAFKTIEQRTKGTDLKTPKTSAKALQKALKNAGFYKGPVDGKTGHQTRESIKAFQKANGLKADGIVGQQTWVKLSRYNQE
jgi:murein L,D-transpeptidase YcbB/YkuD